MDPTCLPTDGALHVGIDPQTPFALRPADDPGGTGPGLGLPVGRLGPGFHARGAAAAGGLYSSSTPATMPIGFFFGAAVGIGVAAWARKPLAMLVLVVTTMYAWSAAHPHGRSGCNATPATTPISWPRACARARSAPALTHLGCSIFSSELRRPWRLSLSCAVGAIAGVLFFLGERKIFDERLLYLVWQPAVAFCIGLGLSPPRHYETLASSPRAVPQHAQSPSSHASSSEPAQEYRLPGEVRPLARRPACVHSGADAESLCGCGCASGAIQRDTHHRRSAYPPCCGNAIVEMMRY